MLFSRFLPCLVLLLALPAYACSPAWFLAAVRLPHPPGARLRPSCRPETQFRRLGIRTPSAPLPPPPAPPRKNASSLPPSPLPLQLSLPPYLFFPSHFPFAPSRPHCLPACFLPCFPRINTNCLLRRALDIRMQGETDVQDARLADQDPREPRPQAQVQPRPTAWGGRR